MNGLKRLFTSSKYLLTGVVCVGIIVMNVLGRVDGPQALEAILLVVGLALGATAVEDAAKKIRGSAGDPKAVMDAAAPLIPLLTAMVQKLFDRGPSDEELLKSFADDESLRRTVEGLRDEMDRRSPPDDEGGPPPTPDDEDGPPPPPRAN